MDRRFPPIEPSDHGWLAAPGGHEIYWERCGSPAGAPVLFLHGGPGAGASPGQRRFFDPSLCQIVLFDQRGCGRSRPLASAARYDLRAQTTQELVADIERLREHLGVRRWVNVLGLSWGTTLGLAYAHAHPERVGALTLALVTTTSRSEVDWITEGVGRLFPHEYERFVAAVPERMRGRRRVDAYADLLADPDPAVHDAAARAWCDWEDAHVSLTPGHRPSPLFDDARFRLGFARLVTHYWRHEAFLDGRLLPDAAKLDGIPAILLHGRYDVSSPLATVYDLSRRWRTSTLRVLGNAGHGGGEDFVGAVVDACSELLAR